MFSCIFNCRVWSIHSIQCLWWLTTCDLRNPIFYLISIKECTQSLQFYHLFLKVVMRHLLTLKCLILEGSVPAIFLCSWSIQLKLSQCLHWELKGITNFLLTLVVVQPMDTFQNKNFTRRENIWIETKCFKHFIPWVSRNLERTYY